MCNGGPFTATYYCGTVDGEILCWKPFWDTVDPEEVVDIMERETHLGVDVDEVLLRKHTLALKAQELKKSMEY